MNEPLTSLRPSGISHHVSAPREAFDELTAKAEKLSPGAIPTRCRSLQAHVVTSSANPTSATPLRALYAEIDRLIELVNIAPLLTALEQKEKELFGQAQQAIASA